LSVSKEELQLLKNLHETYFKKFREEYNRIEKKLFDKYCEKRHYKERCDPHCVMAYTNTCEYLKEMNKIWNIVGYQD